MQGIGWTVVTFLAAAGITLWMVPPLRRAALRFGITDKPDGKLKTHREPVPYLGGLAIYLGFLGSLALTVSFTREVLGLLLAGSLIVLLGLLDDFGQLSPWTKLAGQALAVAVLFKSGLVLQLIFLPLWISLPLSAIWILSVTNAFNLIDIMDGLSAGTAAVAAVCFAIIALFDGNLNAAVVAAALAGACLGFLRFNFQPAKIYMGDTGSLFLGLCLGALALENAYTRIHPLGALAPALILGVPLFDMLFVMWIRRRRGIPMMLGSPDHVALRLRKWRLSTRQTVLASYAATALLGGTALWMTRIPLQAACVVLGGLVVLALSLALMLKRIDMSL